MSEKMPQKEPKIGNFGYLCMTLSALCIARKCQKRKQTDITLVTQVVYIRAI